VIVTRGALIVEALAGDVLLSLGVRLLPGSTVGGGAGTDEIDVRGLRDAAAGGEGGDRCSAEIRKGCER
jgi:hypothetical protein